MTEGTIRKCHRSIGISLSIFILLQVGSGLVLSLLPLISPAPHAHNETIDRHDHADNDHDVKYTHRLMETIHRHGGTMFNLYRVVLSLGMIGMVMSGVAIFFMMKKRASQRP